MTPDELAHYAGISTQELERLLAMPAAAIYNDPDYIDLVTSLDREHLDRTAVHTRDAYDKYLPTIKEQFGLRGSIMSGYTLSNWVLGFLMYPERLSDMIKYHASLSPDMIARLLPHLVRLLDEVPEGREEWQRALVILSLPLLAPN